MNVKGLFFAAAVVSGGATPYPDMTGGSDMSGVSGGSDMSGGESDTSGGGSGMGDEEMKKMMECSMSALKGMCKSCVSIVPDMKEMCDGMENAGGRRMLNEDGSPLDIVKTLDDAGMKKFCAKGGCSNVMVETIGKMRSCMPEAMLKDADMPAAADMKKVMTGFCSSNPAGEYCAKKFNDIEATMKDDGEPTCAQLVGLGCCAGNIVETMTVFDGDEAAKGAKEAFTKCGYEGVPKSCPKPGESSTNVEFGVKLGDAADLSDKAKKDAYLEKLATELAKELGVKKEDLLTVVDEKTKEVKVYVTGGDAATVETKVKEKADAIGKAATTAATDSGVGGTATVPKTEIKTETQKNEGAAVTATGTDQEPEGSSASALISSALVASVVSLFA